jgi:hypothetical protein
METGADVVLAGFALLIHAPSQSLGNATFLEGKLKGDTLPPPLWLLVASALR